ncbi:Metallo-dependent phosphatase-like protein [Xylariaceae sp. FL0016]|nr:Metallo-dependent phosphatase-like protein [Xylariaceae sp. FL0016]
MRLSRRRHIWPFLGDIGCISHKQEYFEFLRRQLLQFRIVFLVLGNHEPWYSTWDRAKEEARQFESDIATERQATDAPGNFVLLDRNAYHLREPSGESAVVLGCTLFSRVPTDALEAVSFGINDFYHTENWTVEQHTAQFEGDVRWLNEQVASHRGEKIIVLTHYNPTMDERTSDPRHGHSSIRSGFATDLSKEVVWLNGDVKVWAFDHTHYKCDYVDEETGKRVVANQRGYYFLMKAKYFTSSDTSLLPIQCQIWSCFEHRMGGFEPPREIYETPVPYI